MSTRALPHSPVGYAPRRVVPGVRPPWTPGDWTRVGMEFAGRVQALRQPIGGVADVLATPSGTYPVGYAYIGGVLLPDGRVFCVPHNAASARIYGNADYQLPPARVLSSYDNKF